MQDINEFVIFKLDKHTNAERRPNTAWPKFNQLLFDLGSDREEEEDIEYVKSKIAEFDQQFDLGLCDVCCFVV